MDLLQAFLMAVSHVIPQPPPSVVFGRGSTEGCCRRERRGRVWWTFRDIHGAQAKVWDSGRPQGRRHRLWSAIWCRTFDSSKPSSSYMRVQVCCTGRDESGGSTAALEAAASAKSIKLNSAKRLSLSEATT